MEYKVLHEIIYVNTDDFYASTVRLKDPALRSRPVVIGYLSSRGSVVGASYEAREAGVRPGITTVQARRLCPDAAFVQVDWELFRRASRAIFSVIEHYSPLVESISLDEGALDYTGCSALFGDARDLARGLQKEIAEAASLSVSLGLGANVLVSRIASKAAKLGGLVDVPPGREREFLKGFPVDWLPGVSAAWAETLAALGVRTIGTLAKIPVSLIEKVFGPFGKTLAERARGVDNRPVFSGRHGRMNEGLHAEVTFANDIVSAARLEAYLYALAENLGRKLRRHGRGTKEILLRLTYTDGYVAARAARLPRTTALDRELYGEALALLKHAFRRRVKVRALYLAARVSAPFVEQGDLFVPERIKLASLYQACDKVREKYGQGKILRLGKTFSLGTEPASS